MIKARMMTVVFMLIFVQTAAFGQKIWNDLSFGASLANTRKALKQEKLSLERVAGAAANGPWATKPDWSLKIGVQSWHFKSLLWFSQDDRLNHIELQLEGGEVGGKPVALQTPFDVATFHWGSLPEIRSLLSAKYGSPASETPSCNAEFFPGGGEPRNLLCTIVWKAEGQSVTFVWSYDYGGILEADKIELDVDIDYRPMGKSGL
jgi:hypothetical protein